jgi:hypothetical protein
MKIKEENSFYEFSPKTTKNAVSDPKIKEIRK